MDMVIDMLEVEIIHSFYRSANLMLCVTKKKLFICFSMRKTIRPGRKFEFFSAYTHRDVI